MKTKVINNKLLFKLIIITITAIILGILFIAVLSKSNKIMIKDNLELYIKSINKLNYSKGIFNCLISNILYVSAIWILGMSIIGIPIIIIILLFKSFILGFTISSIIYFYKFKGILVALTYIMPLVINLFVIFILSYHAIIFSKKLNKLLFSKKEIHFKNLTKRYVKIFAFSLALIIISSVIEVFLIPRILSLIV